MQKRRQEWRELLAWFVAENRAILAARDARGRWFPVEFFGAEGIARIERKLGELVSLLAPKPVMLVPPALVTAAVAKAQAFPESSAAQSAEPGECRIGGATPIGEATPRKPGAMPKPKSDADCTLIGMYAKKRMLSGPWSASRRLKAARIRGDEEEAKRMEAMLGDLLGKAINAEGE